MMLTKFEKGSKRHDFFLPLGEDKCGRTVLVKELVNGGGI